MPVSVTRILLIFSHKPISSICFLSTSSFLVMYCCLFFIHYFSKSWLRVHYKPDISFYLLCLLFIYYIFWVSNSHNHQVLTPRHTLPSLILTSVFQDRYYYPCFTGEGNKAPNSMPKASQHKGWNPGWISASTRCCLLSTAKQASPVLPFIRYPNFRGTGGLLLLPWPYSTFRLLFFIPSVSTGAPIYTKQALYLYSR